MTAGSVRGFAAVAFVFGVIVFAYSARGGGQPLVAAAAFLAVLSLVLGVVLRHDGWVHVALAPAAVLAAFTQDAGGPGQLALFVVGVVSTLGGYFLSLFVLRASRTGGLAPGAVGPAVGRIGLTVTVAAVLATTILGLPKTVGERVSVRWPDSLEAASGIASIAVAFCVLLLAASVLLFRFAPAEAVSSTAPGHESASADRMLEGPRPSAQAVSPIEDRDLRAP